MMDLRISCHFHFVLGLGFRLTRRWEREGISRGWNVVGRGSGFSCQNFTCILLKGWEAGGGPGVGKSNVHVWRCVNPHMLDGLNTSTQLAPNLPACQASHESIINIPIQGTVSVKVYQIKYDRAGLVDLTVAEIIV